MLSTGQSFAMPGHPEPVERQARPADRSWLWLWLWLWFWPCLALLLGACTTPVLPPVPPQAQAGSLPAHFKSAAPAQLDDASDNAAFGWSAFADPVLDGLMARALQANPQVEIAAARLQQARAALRASASARSPQAALNASAGRQGGPLVNAAGNEGTLLTANIGLAYEADFFGRLAQGEDAARWDARSRAAAWQAARLLVQAEVALTYLTLQTLDAECAVVQQALQARREGLRLVEQRWQRGALPETAVLRERAEAATAEAEFAGFAPRRAALVNGLALLLGESATTFHWPAADNADAAQPPMLPRVPAGLPSGLLARRPDVAAADLAETAARARSGAARAAWWPSFALTASGGQASARLAELVLAGSRAWGLGLLTTLPLFDGGRRAANAAQIDATLQLESAQRRALVLQAFKEVEDQLGAVQALAERQALQAQATAALRRSRALAESRQRQGLASRLDVLAARRAEAQALQIGLQLHAALAQATVGLVKALGGDGSASTGLAAAERLNGD